MTSPSAPPGGATEASPAYLSSVIFIRAARVTGVNHQQGVCVCVFVCLGTCVCVFVPQDQIIPSKLNIFPVEMHPVKVSIPSFRSENNSIERGYTVSCSAITSVCLCLVLPLLLSSVWNVSRGVFFFFLSYPGNIITIITSVYVSLFIQTCLCGSVWSDSSKQLHLIHCKYNVQLFMTVQASSNATYTYYGMYV